MGRSPQDQARLDMEFERVAKVMRGQRRTAKALNRKWHREQGKREVEWRAAELEREKEQYKRIKEEQIAREKEEQVRNARKMVRILKRATVVTERLVKGQDFETRMRRSRIRWEELIDDKYVVEKQIKWERDATALEMRKAGLTYRKIGEHLGVCASRAAQLVWRSEKMRKKPEHLSPVEHYMTESYVSPEILAMKIKGDVQKMKRTLEPFQFKPNRDWLLVDSIGAIAPG